MPLAWLADDRRRRQDANPNGGAIALGHPLGGSGARIMTTLVHHMSTTASATGCRRCARAAARPTPPSSSCSSGPQHGDRGGDRRARDTELGKVYGRSSSSLAAEAVQRAATDAGLELAQLDGLLVSSGIKQDVGVNLASVLALGDLGVLAQVSAFGATAGVMVAQAAQAIAAGAATAVACVFADTPLRPQRQAGSAWGAPRGGAGQPRGLAGWSLASGRGQPEHPGTRCARVGTWNATAPPRLSWPRWRWPSGPGPRATRWPPCASR